MRFGTSNASLDSQLVVSNHFDIVQVISRKDQEQYWYHTDKPYSYVSVDHLSKKFKACLIGQKLDEELSSPYDKSQSHKNALSFNIYSLPKWELFRACMTREWLLMKRNSFVYIFKATQVAMTFLNIFICIISSYTNKIILSAQLTPNHQCELSIQ